MRRFTFTPAAQLDIEEIANYLRTLPKAPALRIGREIQKAIETITAHPHLGRVDEHLTERSNTRVLRFPCRRYVLFYFTNATGVAIVGILHGNRDVHSVMENRLG